MNTLKINWVRKGLIVLALILMQTIGYAQLRKTATMEKVLTIMTEQVTKTNIGGKELYAISLRSSEKYHDPIVFWLGTYEEMISNLKDFAVALDEGKKDEIFAYQNHGTKYTLVSYRVLGQKCFKVYEEYSSGKIYGTLSTYTINRMLEYFGEK